MLAATPDMDMARRFLDAHPSPGPLLQVGVTGAHLYGFPSADSDVDLKGIHVAPVELLLGLDTPNETHDVLVDFEGVEHDLTTHEVAKALTLLLRGNGNMLERLLSPMQVVEHDAFAELQSLAQDSISTAFIGHYRGFFRGMQREHDSKRRAKTMLYSYRVALTGAHLMKTGVLQADLNQLAPVYGYDDVLELVKLKGAEGEKHALDDALDARHRGRWPELEALLDDSLAGSTLPPQAPNRAALNDWLIRLRLASL